ncbi:hypothetical protein A6770_33600 [Nostoc minutum NIES-26]|uniref:Uncharacterized protein n=1 Tax=Nostoc minutum NIES-26 TaxID=1844469 RepID=A0A367Q3H4_9NOSO|nr:hypothetical protein A6770_33600 [Nostoc minutum NIES-26]
MFINTPAIQNPLKSKFPPLLPPSPLGHHLSPLGQNLEIGDFLLLLFQYNLFNCSDYSKIAAYELKFHNLINTNTTEFFGENSDDKFDLELNLDSLEQATDNLFVTTKNISIKKSLGLQTPIAQESDLIASDLISEFLLKKRIARQTLSLRGTKNSTDLTEVIPLDVFPQKTSSVVQTQLNPNQEPASIQKLIQNKTQTIPDYSEAIESLETSVATSNIAFADSIGVQSLELENLKSAPIQQVCTSAQVESTNHLHAISPLQLETQVTLSTRPQAESVVQLQEDLLQLNNPSDQSINQVIIPLQTTPIESKPVQLQLETQTSLPLQKSIESPSGETTFTPIDINLVGIEPQLQTKVNDTQISQHELKNGENVAQNSSTSSSEFSSHTSLAFNEETPKSASFGRAARIPQSNSAQDAASRHPDEYVDNIPYSTLDQEPAIYNSENLFTELPPQQEELIEQSRMELNHANVFTFDVLSQISNSVPLQLQATPTTPETTESASLENSITLTDNKSVVVESTTPETTESISTENSTALTDNKSVAVEPQSEIQTVISIPQQIESVFEESVFSTTNTQSVAISPHSEDLANLSTQSQVEFVCEENTSNQTHVLLVSSDIGMILPQPQQNTPGEPASEADSLAIASQALSSSLLFEHVTLSAKDTHNEFTSEQMITPRAIAPQFDTEKTLTTQEASASVSVQEDSVTPTDINYARTQSLPSTQAIPKLPTLTTSVPIEETADSFSTSTTIAENTELVSLETATTQPNISTVFQSQSTVILTKRENLNLPFPKLLSQPLPLVKDSDLQLSELVAEFANQLPLSEKIKKLSESLIRDIPTNQIIDNIFETSDSCTELFSNVSASINANIPSLAPLFFNRHSLSNKNVNSLLATNFNFDYEKEFININIISDESLLKNKDINNYSSPDNWSSVAELLGKASNYSIENLPYFNSLVINQPLHTINTLSKSHADIKQKPANSDRPKSNQNTLLNLPYKLSKKIPESWSNITDLLGDKPYSSININKLSEDESALLVENLNTEYSLMELSTPFIETSSESTSIENSFTLQSADNHIADFSIIDEEELEILAYKVYIILRPRLEMNHQRQFLPSTNTHKLWNQEFLNNYHLNSTRDAIKMKYIITDELNEALFLDTKLSMLTQEVYFLIKHLIETHITINNYLY